MEKGNLRVDLNVSIMKKDDLEFGVRREVKNLNSFKSVKKAIQYEIEEQTKILESGEKVMQSTMIWDDSKNKTMTIREKEDAHDYRYFPEPDLPPLIISDNQMEKVLKNSPELPLEKLSRFKKEFNLKESDVDFLISDKNIANYFEQAMSCLNKPNQVLNWIRMNIMEILNREKINIESFPISPNRLCQLLDLLNQKKITKDNAKKVFDVMLENQNSAIDIITEMDFEISTDSEGLLKILKKVLSDNPNEYQRLKNGENKLIKFFIGQVMRETKGRYPPDIIIDKLKDEI